MGARTLPDFEVFGLKLLDRQIVRMFKVDLARLSVSKGNSTVFMVDYMFNFSDQNTNSPVSLDQLDVPDRIRMIADQIPIDL